MSTPAWVSFVMKPHNSLNIFQKPIFACCFILKIFKNLEPKVLSFWIFFLKLGIKQGYNKIKEAPNNVNFELYLCVYGFWYSNWVIVTVYKKYIYIHFTCTCVYFSLMFILSNIMMLNKWKNFDTRMKRKHWEMAHSTC
jgi:hypothetical protein